jgi:hydrogenase maturation protease
VSARVLIAGIGNIFLGDDGFGCAVARALLDRAQPEGVRVADFGIRSFDLACALADPWDAAILVDVVSRGRAPGTLCVLEPTVGAGEQPAALEGHRLDPVRVLALARTFGAELRCLRLVGCEPERFAGDGDDPDAFAPGLSRVVEAAVSPAVTVIERLLRRLGRADA